MCHATSPIRQFPPTSGLHTTHLNSIKVDQADGQCLNCHWNYTYNPLHKDGQIEGFNAGAQLRTPISTVSFGGKMPLDDAEIRGDFYADSANCNNVSCHRAAAPATLNWYVEADCAQCHQLGGYVDPMTTNGSGSSGKHIAHVQRKGISCNVCHVNYKSQPSHMNNIYGKAESVNVVSIGGSWASKTNISGAFDKTTGTCASTSCHSSADWYAESTVSDCTVCHTQGNSSYAPDPWANASHPAHLNGPGIACTDCHLDYSSSPTHFNGIVDTVITVPGMISFDPSKNPSGSYNTGTCSSTMCHGNFPGGNATSPTWGGTANCTISRCHGGNSSGNPASSLTPDPKHGTHVTQLMNSVNPATSANYTEAETCAVCHSGHGFGQSGHANAIVDIAFNYPQMGSTGSSTGGTFNGGTNNFNSVNCSNTYCHGNFTGGNTDTVSYSESKLDFGWCGSCHTTSPTSVKHTEHLNKYVGQCNYCHSGYTQSFAPANHVNFVKNVSFGYSHPGGTVPAAPSYNNASQTCTGVYCHGNFPRVTYDGTPINPGKNFNPVWSTSSTAACGACHGFDTNNYSSPTHGKHTSNSSIYFNNVASIESCDACHNYGADSNQGFTSTSTQGSYGTANHANLSIAATGVNADVSFKVDNADTASRVSPETQVAAHTTWNPGTTTCTNSWCHGNFDNGAGFAGNLSANPNWLNSATAACTTCHATTGINSNSHPKHLSAPYSYSCARCHGSYSGHVNGSIGGADAAVSFTDGMNPNGSYSVATKQCSNLYCHGNALNSGSDWADSSKFHSAASANNNAPIWTVAAGGGPGSLTCESCHDALSSSLTTGSHNKHIGNTAGTYNYACRRCHAGTFAGDTTTISTGHADGTLQISADSNNPSGAFTYGTQTCSSWYCHGTFTGGTSANTAAWNNASSGACGTCHTLAPTNSNYGVHDKHTNTSGTSGYNYDCSNCHNSIASGKEGSSPTLNSPLNTSQHANFAGNVNFNGLAVQGQSPVTASYSSVARTCSNTYCHGKFMSTGSPGTVWLEGNAATVPAWTTGSTAACGSCHGATTGNNAGLGIPNTATAWHASGESHVKHSGVAAASGYSYPCGYCHLGSYDATLSTGDGLGGAYESGTKTPGYTVHANGSREMATSTFYTSFTGASSTRSTGASMEEGSCSSTYCHSDGWDTTRTVADTGGNSSPTWGGGSKSTMTCISCHNNGATPAPRHNGGGEDHYNPSGTDKHSTSCVHCHRLATNSSGESNNSATSTIVYTGKRHVNRWKNVAFGLHTAASSGQLLFSRTSGTCRVQCHTSVGSNKNHSPETGFYSGTFAGQYKFEP